MKRYLVFEGPSYYPGGGWHDYVGSFDDFESAMTFARAKKNNYQGFGWAHVVDRETYKVTHV